jgi:hypothetical protein
MSTNAVWMHSRAGTDVSAPVDVVPTFLKTFSAPESTARLQIIADNHAGEQATEQRRKSGVLQHVPSHAVPAAMK